MLAFVNFSDLLRSSFVQVMEWCVINNHKPSHDEVGNLNDSVVKSNSSWITGSQLSAQIQIPIIPFEKIVIRKNNLSNTKSNTFSVGKFFTNNNEGKTKNNSSLSNLQPPTKVSGQPQGLRSSSRPSRPPSSKRSCRAAIYERVHSKFGGKHPQIEPVVGTALPVSLKGWQAIFASLILPQVE